MSSDSEPETFHNSDEETLKEIFAFDDEGENEKKKIKAPPKPKKFKANKAKITKLNTKKKEIFKSKKRKIPKKDIDSDEELIKEVYGNSSDDEDDSKINKRISQHKKRKLKVLEREKKFMKLVFGDKKGLIEKLGDNNKKEKKSTEKDVELEAAWHDSDDEITVEDVQKTNPQPLYVSQTQNYKTELENNLNRIFGTPDWAKIDKTLVDPDNDADILQSVGHLAKQTSKTQLKKTVLNFRKLNNLNRTSGKEGRPVTSVEFHRSSTVALVTGKRGVATLFAVDGYQNEIIHKILIKEFSIGNARFNSTGNEIIFGGNKNYIFNYDMIKGVNSVVYLPKSITNMTKYEISPNGEYIVVVGKFGELFILHEKTKEHLFKLKQEYQSSGITFSSDSNYILSHSINNEVCIFDIRMNRMIHRFTDEGCLSGTTITASPNNSLLACGSAEGVVNIYNYEDVFKSKTPKPCKSLFNLSTSITYTKFNPTSEILAYCSNLIDDSLKMVHFPSATVFSNVPPFQANLGKPNILSFSPGGKYFAVGNMFKNVSLFSLGHFPHY